MTDYDHARTTEQSSYENYYGIGITLGLYEE